jgi:hypothetical protein
MKGRIYSIVALAGLAGMVLAANLRVHAQLGQNGGGVLLRTQRSQPELDTDMHFAEKRLRAMNADRQKTLVSDADKLVKLARQLDAEIASNPMGEMTPEEIRKAGDIEKLARSVKEKMAQSFTGGPQLRGPVLPIGGPGEN